MRAKRILVAVLLLPIWLPLLLGRFIWDVLGILTGDSCIYLEEDNNDK